jgi:hypothetical protein
MVGKDRGGERLTAEMKRWRTEKKEGREIELEAVAHSASKSGDLSARQCR